MIAAKVALPPPARPLAESVVQLPRSETYCLFIALVVGPARRMLGRRRSLTRSVAQWGCPTGVRDVRRSAGRGHLSGVAVVIFDAQFTAGAELHDRFGSGREEQASAGQGDRGPAKFGEPERVGWPGGVAPPGSLRTVRDSLQSHGSSYLVTR